MQPAEIFKKKLAHVRGWGKLAVDDAELFVDFARIHEQSGNSIKAKDDILYPERFSGFARASARHPHVQYFERGDLRYEQEGDNSDPLGEGLIYKRMQWHDGPFTITEDYGAPTCALRPAEHWGVHTARDALFTGLDEPPLNHRQRKARYTLGNGFYVEATQWQKIISHKGKVRGKETVLLTIYLASIGLVSLAFSILLAHESYVNSWTSSCSRIAPRGFEPRSPALFDVPSLDSLARLQRLV